METRAHWRRQDYIEGPTTWTPPSAPVAARRSGAASTSVRPAESQILRLPYQIAQLYADIDDKEHAFQWLNTAYEIPIALSST